MINKGSLKSGFFWVFVDYFVVKGISFATNIVLAKLLSPKDFGIMGSISVLILIATTMMDSGLASSLIRTNKVRSIDYSTVFVTNIIMSFVVYVILFFLAPFVANFYNQEVLVDILRIYGLVFIISSFYTIQNTILIRDLKFKKIALLNIPGVIVSSVVGIFLGYKGYGVWSIVFSYIVSNSVSSMVFNIFSEWKVSFAFSKEVFYKHFDFGSKLLLSGLLGNFFNSIHSILIGKFFPIQQLGFYERANTFSSYPTTVIVAVLGRVSFPILSKYQDDKKILIQEFRTLIKYSVFYIVLVMISISFWGEMFFVKLLGAKWAEAVPYFRILCCAFILLPLQSLNVNILKIYGKTGYILRMDIIAKLFILLTSIIAFQISVKALVISMFFNAAFRLLLSLYFVSKFIDYSFMTQLKDMLWGGALSIVLFATYFVFSVIAPSFAQSLPLMISFSVVSVLCYIATAKVLGFTQINILFNLLKKHI